MNLDQRQHTQALFRQTQKNFNRIFRDIVEREKVDTVLAEAAFPAYAHHNLLINRLMWDRLHVVFNYLNHFPASRILDFGCGSGVTSWLLHTAGHHVVMFDAEYKPLRLVQARLTFPAGLTTKTLAELQGQEAHAFNFILALDVLEHIKNLPDNIRLFRHLLRDDGQLIVSGPTENILYRLGRRIAGRQFSGDYHVSDIRAIKRELVAEATITPLATLYPLFPLFEVFAARLHPRP
jgi:2-polyprenyl-3-methyl-5-hydroxy-6-metoxy-1,4-benzoquinol methylase